jgi:hypothetical protein
MVKDPRWSSWPAWGGAIASPMVAELVAEHYPNTRVVQLKQHRRIPRGRGPGILENWGVPTAMREAGSTRTSIPHRSRSDALHSLRHPTDLRFAQINSAADTPSFAWHRWCHRDAARGPHEEEPRGHSRRAFRFPFIRPPTGKLHRRSPLGGFYATYVDSVRLQDWVARIWWRVRKSTTWEATT